MIDEIYKTMLELSNKSIPHYIEMVFYITKEQTQLFWDKELKCYEHEKEILFNEWESEGNSRYKKALNGVNFAIQFQYEIQ